jgi:hypothetical protein
MQIPRSFRRSIKRLGPYQSLLVLAVPLAIVEPLKLIAVYFVGEGHFVAGTFLMICAYAGSLFVTERLFIILKTEAFDTAMVRYYLDLVYHNSRQDARMAARQMDPGAQSTI